MYAWYDTIPMVPMAAEKDAAIIAKIPAAVVNSFFGFESNGVPQ